MAKRINIIKLPQMVHTRRGRGSAERTRGEGPLRGDRRWLLLPAEGRGAGVCSPVYTHGPSAMQRVAHLVLCLKQG